MPDSNDFPLSDAELLFLRELVRTGTRFLVVGIGAAVLQGADAVNVHAKQRVDGRDHVLVEGVGQLAWWAIRPSGRRESFTPNCASESRTLPAHRPPTR